MVGLVPAIPNKVRPPQPLAWPGLVVRGGGWWGAESLISPADNFTERGQTPPHSLRGMGGAQSGLSPSPSHTPQPGPLGGRAELHPAY